MSLARLIKKSPKKIKEEEVKERAKNRIMKELNEVDTVNDIRVNVSSGLREVMGKLKPISYWIKGKINMQGLSKFGHQQLNAVALLIVSELGHKTHLTTQIMSGMMEDIFLSLKDASSCHIKKEKVVDCTLDIKRFINLSVYPVSVRPLSKRIVQNLSAINAKEDKVLVSYDVTLYTGDNNGDCYDALRRLGYVKKMVAGIKIDKALAIIREQQTSTNRFIIENVIKMSAASIPMVEGFRKALM
ncbi:MAG: hypothetical protein FuRV3_gp3 [Hangzhou rhabdovirus 3]|nr:MAG: hypothetical protein FuRV3_gp3 [Hangzhou rhabdovirus 3]